MRAWYHTKLGFSADLCQMLNSESTRLVIRSPEHTILYSNLHPSWDAAIEALKEMANGEEWTSDLTGKPLQ